MHEQELAVPCVRHGDDHRLAVRTDKTDMRNGSRVQDREQVGPLTPLQPLIAVHQKVWAVTQLIIGIRRAHCHVTHGLARPR